MHVEDLHSGTTHHPAVHYIFADDDGGALTDRLLKLNAPSEPAPARSGTGSQGTARPRSVAQGSIRRGHRGTPVQERCVVVALSPDGRTVDAAHSLSGDWQVLGVDVASAPTLEGEGGGGGLMLRVRGTGGVDEDAALGARDSASREASLEAAVATYRERMDELTKILEAGSV